MTRPAENQQTVEAALDRLSSPTWFNYGSRSDDAATVRNALRDLAAQASRTQQWKQLAEDMGEALGRARTAREVDALLARLHDLRGDT